MVYLHAGPDRMKRAVENLHLDSTPQAEVDEDEYRKPHRSRQALDTDTDTAKRPQK